MKYRVVPYSFLFKWCLEKKMFGLFWIKVRPYDDLATAQEIADHMNNQATVEETK